MSYDLMVFDKEKAPSNYQDFLVWYKKQTEWSEERDYNSIQNTSPKLISWFMEMKNQFFVMNGEFAVSDDIAFASIDSENHLTDYSLGSSVIYACFSWTVVEEAKRSSIELAKKYDVGVFDPQSDKFYCCDMSL